MCRKINDHYIYEHIDSISISYCDARATSQFTCPGTEIDTNSKTEKCATCIAADEEAKKAETEMI